MATAATPTSNPEAGAEDPAFVARFGRTERLLHWVHAAGFFGMLGSGLVLYLPALSASVAGRPTIKAVHLGVAAAWMTLVGVVVLGGDRRALRQTRREIERYRPEDLQWLRGRKTPQGRFNAGQKSHAVAQSALAALFALSGTVLWLGERTPSFRFPGTVALHDGAMFIATALLLGHLFLALVWPTTRHAMRGILRGSVRADWAARHHQAWRPATAGASPSGARSRARVLASMVLALAGTTATVAVVRDSRGSALAAPAEAPTASAGPTVSVPAAPLRPGADVLAIQAEQTMSSGDLPRALELIRQAVRQAPGRASTRALLGYILAASGDQAGGERELRNALQLSPDSAEAHFYLGVVRLASGRRQAGRRELRTAIRLVPRGVNADEARRLLRES